MGTVKFPSFWTCHPILVCLRFKLLYWIGQFKNNRNKTVPLKAKLDRMTLYHLKLWTLILYYGQHCTAFKISVVIGVYGVI